MKFLLEIEKGPNGEEGIELSGKLVWILLSGFAVIFIGVILVAFASMLGGNSSSVGGIIFIGPFPIVFGAGPSAPWLIAVGVILAFIIFVLLFVMRRRIGRSED